MKRSFIFAFALLLASCAGCAAIVSALTTVLRFADVANVVLNSIESYEHQVSRDHEAELISDIGDLLRLSRADLASAVETVKHMKDPTPEQIEVAFADFYARYEELLRVSQRIGVRGVPLGHASAMAASRGELTVPDLDALKASLRQ